MTTRFGRGDVVELPKRLGGGRGTVAYSGLCGDGVERTVVQRIVDGRSRQTVVREDELFRLSTAVRA